MFNKDKIYTIIDRTTEVNSEFVRILSETTLGDDIFLELQILEPGAVEGTFKDIGVIKYRFLKDVLIMLRDSDNAEVK